MNLIPPWPLALAALAFAVLAEGPGPAPPPAPSPPRPDSGSEPVPRVPGAGDRVSISGRVASASGNPLPEGLSIEVRGEFPEGRKKRRGTVPVEADGTFRVDDLLNGRAYEINVWAYHSFVLGSAARVPAGTSDLVITLESTGSIEGVVLDSQGRRVGPGLVVHAGLSRESFCGTIGDGEASSTRTRKDGSFVLEFLGNHSFTVSAQRGEGPTLEAARAYWLPRGSRGVVLTLGPRAGVPKDSLEPAPHEPAATAITGRVVHPLALEPGEHLTVLARPEGGGEEVRARVSPSGVFDTGTLTPGIYTLLVRSSENPAGERKGVAAGTRGVDIGVDIHGCISGQVMDSAGKPVGKGVVVTAEAILEEGPKKMRVRSSALTRADGSFVIRYLGDHEFSVWAHPSWRAEERTSDDVEGWSVNGLRPDVKGLVVHLVAPASLSGRVRREKVTPPPHALRIRADQPGRGRPGSPGREADVDAEGNFRLEGLAAGRARLVLLLERGPSQYPHVYDLGEFEVPGEGLDLEIPAK